MNRIDGINSFYELLYEVESKSGIYLLPDCNARMNWPEQSVYFFFEKGETREASSKARVVGVGYTTGENDKNTLWAHLRQHRGTIAGKHAGGGNHRISNFRWHLGTALMNRDGIECQTWGKRTTANAMMREDEYPLEKMVSTRINSMPFLRLKVTNRAGFENMSRYMQKNIIALLSNYGKAPVDGPSDGWLGAYCANPFIVRSGLWNVEYVREKYDPVFMEEFRRLVK